MDNPSYPCSSSSRIDTSGEDNANTETDMGYLAFGLYEQIQALRDDPEDFFNVTTVRWAKQEVLENWIHSKDTYPALEWNEALARSARQVLNEQGACRTNGDANGDDFEDVLSRYYAFDYSGLETLDVTSCELVDVDDILNSPRFALEYILSQECIDKSLLRNTDANL
jgi:hypothetical protein